MKKMYLAIFLIILVVFVFAGAIGNLIDRICFNYVTDFIKRRRNDPSAWPELQQEMEKAIRKRIIKFIIFIVLIIFIIIPLIVKTI